MDELGNIKKLIDFAREQGLKSFGVETESMSVSFEFADSAGACSLPVKPEAKASDETHGGSFYVDSPLDGKFYRSPSPEAEPYVEIGSKVSDSETVCIIEAMKVMNEILAERPGKVAKILCQNGDEIRAGQHLILIEPV